MPFALDVKVVEVAVVPTHRLLDVEVEFMELAVRDLDPPPDLGLDAEEGQLELVDGVCWLLRGSFLGELLGSLFLGHDGCRRRQECGTVNYFCFLRRPCFPAGLRRARRIDHPLRNRPKKV